MDLTRIRGIAFDVDGVLSPCTIPMSEDGEPCRLLNVKDGYAIQLAVKKGLRLAIISGGRSKAVALRYRNLGVQDVFMGDQFKLPLFEQWLEETGLDASEVIFVGDDIPDIQVMKEVGLPVCPADASPEVKEISKFVSEKPGGKGAVRDVIERVLKVQGKWMTAEAYAW